MIGIEELATAIENEEKTETGIDLAPLVNQLSEVVAQLQQAVGGINALANSNDETEETEETETETEETEEREE